MTNVIIGTAGHIDHGKTTLIKALTGRNTDNLQEEIKRGISINLGFTYFDLPNGKRAGVIDVPGHEKFIKNMIAGATSIDIVLLTIAANEGVKPQTIEHVDILNYLNIKQKIIVLTKSDLADDVMKELVIDDIKEKLQDTIFEDAEIIEVDSISGKGLDQLIDTIDRLATDIETKNASSPPRLYIDRIFSLKGFGTIVTGTLIDGKISIGDELTIFPKGLKAKIRSVQVHEKTVDMAYAGQRTALNISNLKVEQLNRGDVISQENSMEITSILDVKITLVSHTDRECKLWDRVRVYMGSKEILARIVPLDKDIIKKGESFFCQLRLEEPIVAKKDDKFVIRHYSPLETIGGGIVLDPNPIKHGKSNKTAIEALKVKETGSISDIIEDYIKNNYDKNITSKNLADYIGIEEKTVMGQLETLIETKIITSINNFYFHMDNVEEFNMSILEALSAFHEKHPLRSGMSKEELRSKTGNKIMIKEFDKLLKYFESTRQIKIIEQNLVSLYKFQVVYSTGRQKIRDEIEETLLKSKFSPPPILELTMDNKKDYIEVLESLISDIAISLDNQTVIHVKYYNEARELLANYVETNGTISLAQFRDLINSSRKYAVLLLDDFDKKKFTIRMGDERKLLKR